MAFPLHNCAACPNPSADFCFSCGRWLCEQHISVTLHGCTNLDTDAASRAQSTIQADKLRTLLSSIDMDRMLNNAIKMANFPPETLRDCRIEVPAPGSALMCGKHIHLPIVFSNGDKWVARIALTGGRASPDDLMIKEIRTELATLTALESVSMRIARAKSPTFLENERPFHFFLEWLDGKPSSMGAELAQKKVWISELANEYLKLETLTYDSIGSLTFEGEDVQNIFVGPIVEPPLCGRDEHGVLVQLGPFTNAQDFRVAQAQQVLSQIENGSRYPHNAVDAYLVHLELVELIKILYPMRDGPRVFYIKHADDKDDQWLFQGDSLSGIIDWEWAYTTTKEEAFCAPRGLIDLAAFFDEGSNDLGELEESFAAAFDSLERPDLAALVRGGKKYQRLSIVIGLDDFCDLPNLFLAFRQLVLGDGTKLTFEEWRKAAWEKYKGLPFLATKAMA